MSSRNRQEVSDVWKHFVKVAEAPNKAKCKYCNRHISRGGKNAVVKGYTTSNMWAHVRRFHQEEIKTERENYSNCEIESTAGSV